MDSATKQLKGSPGNDEWKLLHKQLSSRLWGADVDFLTVEKFPTPHIAAVLDRKNTYLSLKYVDNAVVSVREVEPISFTEVIAYNHFLRVGIPVFIVAVIDQAAGQKEIYEYLGGCHKKPTYELKKVATINTWKEYEAWELRQRHASRERYRTG